MMWKLIDIYHDMYIPMNMHTLHTLLIVIVVWYKSLYPYFSRLLDWHSGNFIVATVLVNQPWRRYTLALCGYRMIWWCNHMNLSPKQHRVQKIVCIFYRICISWVLIYRLTSNNQSQSNISFIMSFFVHITTIIEDYNQAFRKCYIYQQSNQPFKPCKISPWNTTRFH